MRRHPCLSPQGRVLVTTAVIARNDGQYRDCLCEHGEPRVHESAKLCHCEEPGT